VKWASFGRSKHDQVLISFPNLFGVLSQNNAFLVLYTWFDFLVFVLPLSPTTTILWLPHPEGDGQMHDILHVAMGQYLGPSKNHRFPTGFLKWASPVLISVMVIHDLRLESRARGHLAFHRGEKSKWHTLLLFNIAAENGPFIDDFPIKTSIYKGFSMAMLNNQMVDAKLASKGVSPKILG
jgi:hypothetical protein